MLLPEDAPPHTLRAPLSPCLLSGEPYLQKGCVRTTTRVGFCCCLCLLVLIYFVMN